jgi:hypothetical protein
VVPYLRELGDRRCYAFAEFKSEEDSIDFLEKHYPALEFSAADGSPARVPIAYSRERRPAANPDDWQCTMVRTMLSLNYRDSLLTLAVPL